MICKFRVVQDAHALDLAFCSAGFVACSEIQVKDTSFPFTFTKLTLLASRVRTSPVIAPTLARARLCHRARDADNIIK